MDTSLVREHFADIVTELTSKFVERNALIDEMEALRFMENDVEVPVGMEKEVVRAPTAFSIIENIVGTLVANDPQIRVPPAAMTPTAQASSSNLEKWTYGALTQLRMQQNEDVFERFMECLTGTGHGCMRMVYAPQLWRGFPRRDKKNDEKDEAYNERSEAWKQGRPLPISWTWIDPRCAYPVWSDLGLEAVLELDYRDPLAISRYRFNLSDEIDIAELERSHVTDSGEIEFAQLWTRKTLTYAIDGVVVHHEKHKYPNIPYIYGLGQAVASKDRARMGLSVLYPLRHLLPYLDRVLSQRASSIRLYAWPTPVIKQAPFTGSAENLEGDDGGVREIEFKPGKPFVLLPGEEVTWLVVPTQGPDIDRQVAIIMDFCDKAGIPGTTMGVGMGDSGYAINQLIGAARMKLKPLIRHGEDALRQVIRTLYDIVEYQVRQPVPVYLREKNQVGWMSIGPDDLKGYRHVEVNLNPLLPTDTYAKSSQAINEYNSGLRARRSAREMIGIEQPEDEENQRLIELFLDRQEIQDAMSQAIVRKFGFALDQQQSLPAGELVQRGMEMPPAYQQAITDSMQGQPTQGQPPQGGPPPEAMGPGAPGGGQVDPQVVAQALQAGQVQLPQLVQMVMAGQLSIEVLAQLVAMGVVSLDDIGSISPEIAAAIMQLLQQMQSQPPIQSGGQPPGMPPIGGGVPMGAGPGGANFPMQPGPNMAGGPPAAVQGSPNVQAAPGRPNPNSAAQGAGRKHVGRVVRPSGVGTGKEPSVGSGVRRQ